MELTENEKKRIEAVADLKLPDGLAIIKITEYTNLKKELLLSKEIIANLTDALKNKTEAHLQNIEYQTTIATQEKNIANLKTVMIAAAEEIMRFWPAHCDAEGYGPSNLMHRLEKGIPAQYGYTAGTFEAQEKRIAEMSEALRESIKHIQITGKVVLIEKIQKLLNPL